MEYMVLTQNLAEMYLPELIEIDRYYYEKMGNSFSEQCWGAQ